MKLEDIGFYTLEDERAKNCSIKSPLWRCELIITDKCNFKCPYCRGIQKEHARELSYNESLKVIDYWADEHLKNIRFSGGEPTLHPNIVELVKHSKDRNIGRIAISTNGSASFDKYEKLIDAGCNDFSVSLDACCSVFGNKMIGVNGYFNKVIENISKLSKLTYTTVGIVITKETLDTAVDVIKFAHDLGVSDIRVITAAQENEIALRLNELPISILDKHPILKYRVNNLKQSKPIRGISEQDCHKCWLVVDDMAILNNHHFPCIIYLRERGLPIGKFDGNVREQRFEWMQKHNSFEDPICRNNCLDVCKQHNTKTNNFKMYGE